MKRCSSNPESGNVLFYILIAVALLAGLSYAISQNNRSNVSQLDEEKARIYATEILDYAGIVANAVAQLKLRGCTDDQISFENNIESDYVNANAPTDNSCHVFHNDGGGLQWKEVPAEWLDAAWTAQDFYGPFLYTGGTCVYNIGTTSGTGTYGCGSDTDGELMVALPFVNQQICIEINELIGVTNPSNEPPMNDGRTFVLNSINKKFSGSYVGQPAIGDGGGEGDYLIGKTAACVEGAHVTVAAHLTPVGSYHFYKVLIAR